MKDGGAKRMPTIWMNVTTSVNWTRPAVGIVRVEQELARALAKLYGGELRLCIFSGGKFHPYNPQGSESARKTAGVLLATAPISPKRTILPRSTTFDPVLGKKSRHSEFTPVATAQKNEIEIAVQDIAYGDVILSVGLDWDYSYVNIFRDLKVKNGIKVVTCCYDLIPAIFPQYCAGDVAPRFKHYFSKLAWSSSTVLCISKQSRDDFRDMMHRVGAPEVETLVIPLGDNLSGGDAVAEDMSDAVLKAFERPFILFVSTIERRKNHEVLYRAYRLLAQEGHGKRLPRLVFVGMPGWGVGDLLKDIELDPLTRGLIVQLNHVTDAELGYLYEKAQFCVYPSLYEGWGLPVGEALARGKVVVASGEGSIPEVGGDLVTYLDPWNPRAWADEILALVDHPERLAARARAVREGYRVRTWRDTAEVVKSALDILREPQEVAVTLYPGYDMYTMSGVAFGQAMHSTGMAGSLTHGPYRALPAGTYDIVIALDKLEGAAGTLRCVMRSDQARRDHGAVDVTFDEHEHFNLLLKIEGVHLDDQVDDYEICIDVSQDLLVAVEGIEIKSSPTTLFPRSDKTHVQRSSVVDQVVSRGLTQY